MKKGFIFPIIFLLLISFTTAYDFIPFANINMTDLYDIVDGRVANFNQTNTTSLYINGTRITNGDTDTVWTLGAPWLYNSSATATFNETKMNLTINALENDTTYTAGDGITLTGTQINHTNTSSQANVSNSGFTFIQDILMDTFGHIQSITSAAVGNIFNQVVNATSNVNFGTVNTTDLLINDSSVSLDLSTLQTDNTTQASQIAILTIDNTTQASQIAILTIDNTTQSAQIALLVVDNTTQGALISTNIVDIAVLQTDNTTQGALIATNIVDITVLRTDNTTQAAQIVVLTTDNSTQGAQIALLVADNTTQGALIATNIVDIAVLRTDNTTQAAQLVDGVTDNTTQATEIDAIQTDVTVLQTDNTTQGSQIAILTTDNTTQDGLFYDSSEAATFVSMELNGLLNLTNHNITSIDQLCDNATVCYSLADLNTTGGVDLSSNVSQLHTDNTTQAAQLVILTTDNTTQSVAIIARHIPGVCPAGQFVQNTTTSGVECLATAGSGDITAVYTNASLKGGSVTGDVNLSINETYLALLYGSVANVSQLHTDNTTQAAQLVACVADNTTQASLIDTNIVDIAVLQTDNTTQAAQIALLVTDNTTQGALIATNIVDIAVLRTDNSTQATQLVAGVTDNSTQAAEFYGATEDATFNSVTSTVNISVGGSLTFPGTEFRIEANATCIRLVANTTVLEVCV